jgi:K+/H+ antiporter YhaU regulatory subunit KhtT
MRTRYLLERERLLSLGAHDVVAEEVEGAVEIISRMLAQIGTPRNVIDENIRSLRSTTQISERKQTLKRSRLGDHPTLSELKIESFLVRKTSPVVDKSPASLRIRSEIGALVVGVRRVDNLLVSGEPTQPFQAGDIIYFVGTSESLIKAGQLADPRDSSVVPTQEASV